MIKTDKVPVTILTGFLGSGKTTLLNRILTEEHGRRIAVIENEFGEVGIDQGLVINADEEVFEMSNGCICCTVRGDLIRVLGNLMKRRDKFDYVLVETTGLADPGPVAQTFFMDDEIRHEFTLDGIVTLVDSGHINQQIGRSDESTEQIAFADVLILNKQDLVTSASMDELESRVREMNRMAKVLRCQDANVPIETVLNLSAFDLDKTLERRPTFLEPEYPFEWTGVYKVTPNRYELTLDEGPDPNMSLVALVDQGSDKKALDEGAEKCVRLYAEDSKKTLPNKLLSFDSHLDLQLQADGEKSFFIDINKDTNLGIFTQHTAEEFNIKLFINNSNARGLEVPFSYERTWVAQHEHDDEVTSFAIEKKGDVDPELINTWLSRLLAEKGIDIFRMKGFVSIANDPRRYVFQGVHMLFDSQPERDWQEGERSNQIVFIGRNLDEEDIRKGFDECLI